MTFSSDVAAFEAKVKARQDLVLRKVCLDMFRRVVMKTPVDTGRARGNWMVGVNHIPMSAGMGIDSAPMGRIINDVQTAKFGDRVALANSVAYIGKLEYGGFPDPPKKSGGKTSGGFSTQAPNGMVRTTIEEYLPTLKAAVRVTKLEIP